MSIGLDDDNFSDIIRMIPPRSVLLLKNIDSFVKERGNKKGKKAVKAEGKVVTAVDNGKKRSTVSTDLGDNAKGKPKGVAEEKKDVSRPSALPKRENSAEDGAAKAEKSELGEGDGSGEGLNSNGSFVEGVRVTVRYNGKGKPCSGKIKRVNKNETFCIDFDDGDSDESVPKELITLRIGAKKEGSDGAPILGFGMPGMAPPALPTGFGMPGMGPGAPWPMPAGEQGEAEETDEESTGEEGEEEETDEETDKKELGYSAVLNALDGALANNQGLTIIMTTNNYEKLTSPAFAKTSEALFRPGRVDLRAFFGHPDERQLRKFFADFFVDQGMAPGSAESLNLKELEDRFIKVTSAVVNLTLAPR